MASTQAQRSSLPTSENEKPMSEKQRLKLEKFAIKKEKQTQQKQKQQQQQSSSPSKDQKSKKQDVPAVESKDWIEETPAGQRKILKPLDDDFHKSLHTPGCRICLVQLLGRPGTVQAAIREGWQSQAERQIRHCHPAA